MKAALPEFPASEVRSPSHSAAPHLWSMIFWMGVVVSGMATVISAAQGQEPQDIRGELLLVIGSPGTPEYAAMFHDWGQHWVAAAQAGHLRSVTLGLEGGEPTWEQLQESLKTLSAESALPLWIVLIGHGTFDGQTARFNLLGPDLEPEQLQDALGSLSRPVALIDCSSASAPFLAALAAPRRVVITATSSGNEVNLARFGGFLADSIINPEADLDKDRQVSLLEAFLRASRLTDQFYESDGRLPTEHAALDDNGDGKFVTPTGFEGVRPLPPSEASNLLQDGLLAHQWMILPGASDAQLTPAQLARRNELELQIVALRNQKDTLSADDYYAALEPLFVELARLQQTAP